MSIQSQIRCKVESPARVAAALPAGKMEVMITDIFEPLEKTRKANLLEAIVSLRYPNLRSARCTAETTATQTLAIPLDQ